MSPLTSLVIGLALIAAIAYLNKDSTSRNFSNLAHLAEYGMHINEPRNASHLSSKTPEPRGVIKFSETSNYNAFRLIAKKGG